MTLMKITAVALLIGGFTTKDAGTAGILGVATMVVGYLAFL